MVANLKFQPAVFVHALGTSEMETGSLETGDTVYIQGPTTGSHEIIVDEIRVDLKKVKKTKKGETCSIPLKPLVRWADKVYKIVHEAF